MNSRGYWHEVGGVLGSHTLLVNLNECPAHLAQTHSSAGLLGGYDLEAATPAFSLFPKVISLKEGDFFFDSLRQVSDWVKKNRPQKEGEGTSLWKGWLPAASLERFQTPHPFLLIPMFR